MKNLMDRIWPMPDVQSSGDTRYLPIQRVGVRRVRYPMLLALAQGGSVATVASWTLTVALQAKEKGTHMSRFMELLEDYRDQAMTPALFQQMTQEMLSLLDAEEGDITVAFPYFMLKSAPVSGVQSLLDYEVRWIARAHRRQDSLGHQHYSSGQQNEQGVHPNPQQNQPVEFELIVQVPLTSLCPCSKAISAYGAHNQRSQVTVSALIEGEVEMDEIIRLIEAEGSCELWALLKRPDEKFVTEYAYDNPKFVEDLVRDVAMRLAKHPAIRRYCVEAENFESIHNHSAYATLEG